MGKNIFCPILVFHKSDILKNLGPLIAKCYTFLVENFEYF